VGMGSLIVGMGSLIVGMGASLLLREDKIFKSLIVMNFIVLYFSKMCKKSKKVLCEKRKKKIII